MSKHYPASNLTDIIKFGKHKGKTISEIISKDPQYLSYIIKKIGFQLTLEAQCNLNDAMDDLGIEEDGFYVGDDVESVC